MHYAAYLSFFVIYIAAMEGAAYVAGVDSLLMASMMAYGQVVALVGMMVQKAIERQAFGFPSWTMVLPVLGKRMSKSERAIATMCEIRASIGDGEFICMAGAALVIAIEEKELEIFQLAGKKFTLKMIPPGEKTIIKQAVS